jgi:predicted DNA-binding transcriptional regulator AlpA
LIIQKEVIRTMSQYMTIDDLALMLGRPVWTIRKWRATGYGPRGVRIGRRVMYRRRDVDQWLDAAFDKVD